MAQKNYQKLLESLETRSNPERIALEKAFSDELGRIQYKYALIYVERAMRGVEPAYTQNTIEAGKKVLEKLKAGLTNVDFEFQGSVMTNTNVKGYSDIDLLTIASQFHFNDYKGIDKILENSTSLFSYTPTQISRLTEAKNSGKYTGNYKSDLQKLRSDDEQILKRAYDKVDISNPKSIIVSVSNPKRDVDVVVANWYSTANYYLNNDKVYRGIQVFDKALNCELPPDYPFLAIKRINEKDNVVNGRLKKMIRFLKNVKGDSAIAIELSSFDINAICYEIDRNLYGSKSNPELVKIISDQMNSLITNNQHRYNLKSVDEKEYIFRSEDQVNENTKKVQSLKQLAAEVYVIIQDLKTELIYV